MKIPSYTLSQPIRAVLFFAFALSSLPVSASPLPPLGTPLLGDPNFQDCFDEQVVANGWTTSEEVTALSCPDRDIRDLNGLEIFQELRELDLRRNRIEFAYPIDQLSQLEVLNLSGNRLWDLQPLNSLFNLRELYLSENQAPSAQAPGVSLATVNPILQSNFGLTQLGVGGMPMDNLDQLVTFGGSLGLSNNLIELDVSNTGIYSLDSISRAANLRVLDASSNELFFANGVDQLTQLESLDLSHNPLFDIFPLQFLQTLRQLNLSGNNQLFAGDVQAVVNQNPGISHLYLAQISFTDLNWLPAPGPQGEYNLVELDISGTGSHGDLYPLAQYSNLRLLKAAGNGLGDLWAFGNLMQLEELDLSDNRLSFVGALTSLDKLTKLNLSGNSAIAANEIVSVVQSNPGLTHLGVSGLRLDDLDWLPARGPQGEFDFQELMISGIGKLEGLEPIGQYSNLRVLEASGNHLQTMWGGASLPRLEVLDVSDNQLWSLYELQFSYGLAQLILSGNARLPFNEVQTVISSNPGLTHVGIAGIPLDDLLWLPPAGPAGEFDLRSLDISNTGNFIDLGPLAQYVNLRELKAAGNRLHSAATLGQLDQLELLDLSNNKLTDIFALQSLTRLRELYLSSNQPADSYAPGIDLFTLNQVLGNNPDLTHLGLGGVLIEDLTQLVIFDYTSQLGTTLLELDVTNTGIEYIDPVMRAQNLRVLKLAGNRLEYIYSLESLAKLEVLDLADNRLRDIIPLQYLHSLRRLDLSGNDRLQLNEVQNAVFGNAGLTHLGLADIPLTDVGWLPQMSPGAYDLVELNVSNTGALFDLVSLQSYRNLRVLEAAGNGMIHTWGAEQLTQLEVLNLADNQLQNVFPLLSLGSLKQLNLSGNSELLSADVQTLVQANPGLTHIAVAGIAFSDTSWLPPSGPQGEYDLLELDISNTFSQPLLIGLSSYRNLQVLRAAGNDLEWIIDIDLLSRLEVLDLGDNRISDANQLLALNSLRELTLSGNDDLPLPQLQAIVQANPNLTHLGLAGIAMSDLNWLPPSGPFGEFNLQELDVSRTDLSDLGVLGRYPDLRVLRAAGNRLQSIYFGQRMDIEILDLSDNQLWDIFALRDLDQLRELDLSGNQTPDPGATGVDLATVNQIIGDNPELTRLGLGGIAIGDLSQLAIFGFGNPVGLNLIELDIGDTGISDIFRLVELPGLQVLNLSGNQIFDVFPITTLQQLTDLDLSNSALEYVLPLGDLANLGLLDLRGNDSIQCIELDELEMRLGASVVLRPASCILGLPPSVSILSPAPGTSYFATDLIAFMAVAGDPEDGDLSGQIQWTSDLAGSIGSGHMFDLALAAGDHLITASVIDGDGNSASIAMTIIVMPNSAPVVTIDSVLDGAVFDDGEPVLLSGTATDAEDGDVSPAIQWSSNFNGALGAGSSIQAPLWVGEHIISASITDSAGAMTIAAISLRINDLPQLSLQSPPTGGIYQQDDSIGLVASATDSEDGNLDAAIQWSSDLDGFLGSGGQLNAVLTIGTHVITALVSDADGAVVMRTTTVTINSLPLMKLLSPASGSLFMLQQAVTLNASATDFEDGNLDAVIEWSSNLDGSLGSGGLLITNLSLGTHILSAKVTDSSGGESSVSTQIVIDQIDLDVTVSGSGKRQKATLTWSGSRTDVDIYKNGRLRRSGPASGTTTFRFKNQATFKVCEQETDYCSPNVVVQASQ